MGRTTSQNRAGSNNVNPIRRGFQIDVTSNYALEKMGFDSPEIARRVMESMKKGKGPYWGLQAEDVTDKNTEEQAAASEVEDTNTEYPAPTEERGGWPLDESQYQFGEERGGWPLNPHRYRPDGSVIDGGTEEGIHKGVDCRGMVPGGISGARISQVPEPMPYELSIP